MTSELQDGATNVLWSMSEAEKTEAVRLGQVIVKIPFARGIDIEMAVWKVESPSLTPYTDCPVQPLSKPTGLVYSMRFKYP